MYGAAVGSDRCGLPVKVITEEVVSAAHAMMAGRRQDRCCMATCQVLMIRVWCV